MRILIATKMLLILGSQQVQIGNLQIHTCMYTIMYTHLTVTIDLSMDGHG